MTLKAIMPCLYNEYLLGNSINDDVLSSMSNYVDYVAYEVVPSGGLVWNYNDSYMNPRLGLNGYLFTALLTEKLPLAFSVWDSLVGRKGDRSFGSDEKLWRSSLFEGFVLGVGLEEAKPLTAHRLSMEKHFPEKGYLVRKTSWKCNAHVFTFSCGKGYERIHQQSDHNSFTIAVNGVPVVIDSGPSNEKDPLSFSQSIGHQSILVNGKGMALCGGKASTSGILEQYDSLKDFTYCRGNALPAFRKQKFHLLEKAYREIWLLNVSRDAYVIRDEIKPIETGLHEFEWLLHTPKTYNIKRRQYEPGQGCSKVRLYDIIKTETGKSVLAVSFLGKHPTEVISEVQVNKKAYDDKLIVEHKRHRFMFTDECGVFWVVIQPIGGADQENSGFELHLNEDLKTLKMRWSDERTITCESRID